MPTRPDPVQHAATVGEPGPAPRVKAWRAVARCLWTSGAMLARRRVRLPGDQVGRILHFADGSSTRVYRETAVARRPVAEPCVLVVAFRLRLVRGTAHRLFEAESLLNTPLFVGFPGFVSKLWCAHDGRDVYRGFYEWDGAAQAEHYASCLWRVLELVCVPGSIHYRILPGVRRDDVLAHPALLEGDAESAGAAETAWWRLVPAA